MNKKNLYFFSFFILISLLFSSSHAQQLYQGEDADLYEDIPDICLVQNVEADALDNFKQNTTFLSLYTNITSDALESNFTQELSYTYRDFQNEIDLEVNFLDYFDNEDPNSIRFGEYFNTTKVINIYLGNIYNYTSINFNNDSFYYIRSLNTFKHELWHYYDDNFNGFDNRSIKSQIFNIEYEFNPLANDFVVSNQEYFENISGLGNQSLIFENPSVPAELRNSVNFEGVFDVYDLINHESEIIARISALCVVENSPFNWSWTVNGTAPYRFCEEFNFRDQDLVKFQDVTDEVTEQYFYENYPEFVLEPSIIPSDRCEVWNNKVTQQKLIRDLYGVLGILMDNLVPVIISLTTLLFIGIFMRFPQFFINLIKNLFNR